MQDEVILATLDLEPDAFAVFYRRHVAALSEQLARRTRDRRMAADLCAETFATALDDADRFDPARGLAVDWLDAIARRLLDDAARRGVVRHRARRRLGLAALEPGDGFVAALEEELVEAARFRARHPRHRLALPPVRLRARHAIAALALVAGVGALMLGGGGSGQTKSGRDLERQANVVVPLAPMLSTAACRSNDERGEYAASPARAIAFRDGVDGLRVVSPLGVSDDADCVHGEGPGTCLVVEHTTRYRCFALTDVRAGRALARTGEGRIVGVVPDDVDRVTLSARGQSARAVVVDNVYAARLDVAIGTPVRVAFERLWDDVCQREVSPRLLARVGALRRARDDTVPLPQALRLALGPGAQYRFDGVLLRDARRWGGDGGVEFWTVPVVARGSRWCAPANGVCVVAVPPEPSPDAQCTMARRRKLEFWRVAPSQGGTVIFGIVADDVIAARTRSGGIASWVDARENVIGGVLPFPAGAPIRVDLIRRPAAAAPDRR